jgi:hypothetical protein
MLLERYGGDQTRFFGAISRSNPGVDRVAGVLRVAGRITIAIDIGLSIYQVATAPAVERPSVMAKQIGRIAGAIAGGAAGARACAAAGSVIGLIEPVGGELVGAGVGAVACGIGALSLAESLANMWLTG